MTGQRSRLILSSQARQQFREHRRSIASVSGSEVTARNYIRALTDYIEQLPDFPLRGQAFSLHHPGMRIIGFRKTLLIAFLVIDDSVVILSILSTRQSRLTLEEALTQALNRSGVGANSQIIVRALRIGRSPTLKTAPLPHPTVA